MDNSRNILLQRYELGRLLGQGTFAKVYYARNVQTGQSVAIKVIDKEKVMKVGVMNQIKREISVMRLLRHPHIVRLYEVMATKTKIYFVMEYAKGGELFNKVAKGKLKEDIARKYFQQLINAIDFCHRRGIYHRDLKPENILLDENENLKVTDFGLSALAESKRSDGLLHTTCGTPAYVAPEVIERTGYDGTSADIWSCGVVLFVLLAGHLPFHDSNLIEMYRKIENAEYKFPSWFSPEVRRLLSRILDPNPDSRISIPKIRGSSWLKGGLNSETRFNDTESNTITSSVCGQHENGSALAEEKQELPRLSNLNAFDIISLSDGFDLSKLFEESCTKNEFRFVSWKQASVIISKLEEVAKQSKLKISKKDGGLLKFKGLKQRGSRTLSIDAEIFVLTPVLHLVEVRKTGGDTLEYHKVLDEVIKPHLQDIVWSSQDETPPDRRNQQLEPQDDQPQPPSLQNQQPHHLGLEQQQDTDKQLML